MSFVADMLDIFDRVSGWSKRRRAATVAELRDVETLCESLLTVDRMKSDELKLLRAKIREHYFEASGLLAASLSWQ
jgi:hypothetical protein